MTIVSSAARTTSGDSGSVGEARTDGLSLLVDVTAASGTTPTLDLVVDWSHDGTNWFVAQPADSFTQITAATKAVKRFDVKAKFYRVRWTIAGTTPSFTFAVHQVGVS